MNDDFDLKRWDNVKGKLKNIYPQLTDADLIWRHESKENLFYQIASKLVISKKELITIVDSL